MNVVGTGNNCAYLRTEGCRSCLTSLEPVTPRRRDGGGRAGAGTGLPGGWEGPEGAGSTGDVILRPENKCNAHCDVFIVMKRYRQWCQLPRKVLVPCGRRRWFLALLQCHSCLEVSLEMARESVERILAHKPSS